jgi:hypothetical protein
MIHQPTELWPSRGDREYGTPSGYALAGVDGNHPTKVDATINTVGLAIAA